MPEVNQYSFTHKEVLELLIKKAGLHEGKWQLLTTFSLAAAFAGPTPDQIIPAAIVGVMNLGIQKAAPDAPPGLTLDAAIVNPAST
jgi:hypothetical protein